MTSALGRDWERALTVACPFCHQPANVRCTTPKGTTGDYAKQPHRGRLHAYWATEIVRPVEESPPVEHFLHLRSARSLGKEITLTHSDLDDIKIFLEKQIEDNGGCSLTDKITSILPPKYRPSRTFHVTLELDAPSEDDVRKLLKERGFDGYAIGYVEEV